MDTGMLIANALTNGLVNKVLLMLGAYLAAERMLAKVARICSGTSLWLPKPAGEMPTTERARPAFAASSANQPPMELPTISTGS